MSRFISIILSLFLVVSSVNGGNETVKPGKKKKIYMTFILHGNMNYDRYVKSRIWENFPVIYENLLDYLDENPRYRGQCQLSGQTFKTLQLIAPGVLEHAVDLHEKGRINFTGTFYSEPVNVSIDGETNLRCAKLGTEIIEREIGTTDGFYLQERAYHPQLPWILNQANVTWIPVITGDLSFYPFRLSGMDGSSSVCVPNTHRDQFPEVLEQAPEGSLLMVEGDYEIPQSIFGVFDRIYEYLETHDHIEIEWITVKDYIDAFGVKEERYIDHTAVSKHINHGTYSRWTADPLDMIVQEITNRAMFDFRSAGILSSLGRYLYDTKIDRAYEESGIDLKYDPLIWDIAQTKDYPDVEPGYLKKEGEVTILSKIEHLLVWAVNSDSRGWYPLYEKRRERINALENSSLLSNELINTTLDRIAQDLEPTEYNKYYILFNSQPARSRVVTLETNLPYEVYGADQKRLKSHLSYKGKRYQLEFEAELPAYGYTFIGLKKSENRKKKEWRDGHSIENEQYNVSTDGNTVVISGHGRNIELSLDSFKIKALTEMVQGPDEQWRDSAPYGQPRISVREGLYPELKIEHQIDWLIHMQQVFTLQPDRIISDIDFYFPHPTVLRKEGEPDGTDNLSKFNPDGLNLNFSTGMEGEVFYNIPFGTTPHKLDEMSYFCALNSAIYQYREGGGFVLSAATGEQAFFTDPGEGLIGVFLGASTTSGPVRHVGMSMPHKAKVLHEKEWYIEPFHGQYKHRLMVFPYEGSWQENDAPAVARDFIEDFYLREFIPSAGASGAPLEKSLISLDNRAIDITSMEYIDGSLNIRLNDKEGSESDVRLGIGKRTKKLHIPESGIVTLEFK
ncbi:MAG: hypothetical protein ABFS28_11045 [Bacteroidota bacterium]